MQQFAGLIRIKKKKRCIPPLLAEHTVSFYSIWHFPLLLPIVFKPQCLHFLESRFKAWHAPFPDAQRHAAIVFIPLTDNRRLFLLDNAHDGIHERILKEKGDFLVHRFFYNPGRLYGFDGCCLIGLYQAARPQLDSTEITDDDNQDIRKPVRINLSQNRFPGCTRRLPVVIGTEILPFVSQHVGIATMACIVILLLIVLHLLFHFVYRMHWVNKSQEFTPFLAILPFCRCCYRLIYVISFHIPTVQKTPATGFYRQPELQRYLFFPYDSL